MSKVNKKYTDLSTGTNGINGQSIIANYTAVNYTPTQVASEGTNKESAHFKGIDNAIITKEPVFNGLNNGGLFSPAYNATTRQLTVTYTTGAQVFVNGVIYPKSGTETTTAHANTSGKYFFYYDTAGTLQVSTTVYDLFNQAPIALVYYNSTLVDGVLLNERHLGGANGMDMAVHDNLHNTRGTQLRSGGVASGFTLNTNGLANVSYAISAGSVDDEDLVTATSAQAQGGANTYRILHLTGTTATPVWTWLDDAEGGLQSNGTNIEWNQLTGGNWTLTPITTNTTFVNYYGVLVPALTGPQYIVVMGQTTYGSQAAAQAGSFATDVANFNLFTAEGVAIYQFTYQRNTAFGSPGNTRLMAVTSVKQSVNSIATGSGTVTSVGLVDASGIFTIANSPITTAGTMSMSLNSESANTVLAAPNGSSGTPSFRSLVAADLPTGNVTAGSSKITLGGIPTGAAIGSGFSIDLGSVNLEDLANVIVTSPNIDDRIGWNGTDWVNLPPSTVGAGSGITQFRATPQILATGSNNTNLVNTLSATPVTTAELTITSASVSNTSTLISAWLGNVALKTTSIPAGIWEFNPYCSVSSTAAGRTTTLTTQIYQVDNQSPLTFTTTGSGTTRTLTASGGTPFLGITANANIKLCSYVLTPQGLYQVSAFTSNTVVTITVPSTYANESAVSISIWNPLFNLTSPTITSTGTNYTRYSTQTTQSAFTVNSTSFLAAIDFANMTGGPTTLTISYNDMVRNSNLVSPLVFNHNDLPGLQGGNSTERYHLTNSQATIATQAASASQSGYLTNTDWSTFNGKLNASAGDLSETSFTIANNQTSFANITGFLFANATVRSFKAIVSIYINATTPLYESFVIQGIQRGSDWKISISSVGDASGINFDITSAGQMQYTSGNYTGLVSGTMKFRALTTSV